MVDQHSAVEILGPGGAVARAQRLRAPRRAARDGGADRAGDRSRCDTSRSRPAAGKSLAYLVPMILSGKKAICSTANKALQERIALKDVPFLQSVLSKPFRAVVLKGRRNYVCLQRLDELRQRAATLPGIEFAGKSVAAAQAWPRLANW